MITKKISLNELRTLVKQIIKEETEQYMDHKKKYFTINDIEFEVDYKVKPNKTNGNLDPIYQEVIEDGYVVIDEIQVHDPKLEDGIDREPTSEELKQLKKKIERIENLNVIDM
jgi:hypothetical protein